MSNAIGAREGKQLGQFHQCAQALSFIKMARDGRERREESRERLSWWCQGKEAGFHLGAREN